MSEIELLDKTITELISNANAIAVAPVAKGDSAKDSYAASAGLYYALKAAEKDVSFLYAGNPPQGLENVLSEEDIMSDIGKRSLVISIDYSETPASKVNYTTNDDILRLVLSPVTKDFSLDSVKTELEGFDFDVIITIGAQKRQDYGQMHENLKDEFNRAKVINLDNKASNQRFGAANIVRIEEPSLSLLVLNNLTKWGLRMDTAAARALLKGVSLV
jgi:nanoRNase/pAp phosphatase (c-di-AMP/oligoRNAs hydrolase)